MAKISSCIISFNKVEYLRETLFYYFLNTQQPHDLYIIDNDSHDGSKEFLQMLMSDTFLRRLPFKIYFEFLSKNGQPGMAIDVLYNKTDDKCEYMATVNDKCAVPKDWLLFLTDILEKEPSLGVVNINNGFDKHHKVFGANGNVAMDAWIDAPIHLLRRSLYPKMGYNSRTDYWQHGYEKIKECGYKIGCAKIGADQFGSGSSIIDLFGTPKYQIYYNQVIGLLYKGVPIDSDMYKMSMDARIVSAEENMKEFKSMLKKGNVI